MTPCQGADFRHFPSDTSAVGIWWGLFVFRTIRIWNTNCSCVDASNASPPLYISPPQPLPIVLVNISSTSLHRNKETGDSVLSLMLVKVSFFFLKPQSNLCYDDTTALFHISTVNFYPVIHPHFNYQITGRGQIFKATAYDTKTANKKKTCKQ